MVKPMQLAVVDTVPVEPDQVTTSTRFDAGEDALELAPPQRGRWYWLKRPKGGWSWPHEDHKGPLLVCCTHVGSNFAKVRCVERDGRHNSWRVHEDDYARRLEYAPDAEAYLERQVTVHRDNVRELMGQVRDLVQRLGVGEVAGLGAGQADTQALSTTRGDLGEYKTALVLAQTKTLPELFKRIEAENKAMGEWMIAKTMPLMAEAKSMEKAISTIENRVGNVELYAGITETIIKVTEGEPAAIDEPIHLFQRRLYMDEECLVAYEAGGMEFASIAEFDQWLARPVNRDRILPYPRTIVAFQVRRNAKERYANNLSGYIDIMNKEMLDTTTFLYIRNGNQISCLQTSIDFGADLFPDIEHQDLTGKLWMNTNGSGVSDIINDDRYQGLVEDDARNDAEYKEYKKLSKKERDAHPRDHDFWTGRLSKKAADYEPYTKASVYYDDGERYLQEHAARHNRLVLVIQGLLDRSLVLHPHPEWKLWTGDGFAAALRLIYDNARGIVSGAAPDFEAYRAKCNAQIKVGSIVAGAMRPWGEAMAEIEERRRARRGYSYSDRHLDVYYPHDNPGPGKLARVSRVSRDKTKVTFEWTTQREKRDGYDPIPDRPGWGMPRWIKVDVKRTFTCEVALLFNLDAYTPGDHHQFFDDPRTRADYLQWAPFLLTGEDYKAGKRKPSHGEDDEGPDTNPGEAVDSEDDDD